MAVPVEIIPIEDLLKPVEGDNPSGANLRYSDEYDRILEARRSDDECSGDWTLEPKVSDWAQVISLATALLQNKTKDLMIMGWLTEALANSYGFPGMRDGLKLLRLSLDKFWNSIYPEIDAGDLEGRSNILIWLDRKLDSTARAIPVTDSPTGAKYSYNQWYDSTFWKVPEPPPEYVEDAQRFREHAAAENKITDEQWRAALDTTPTTFLDQMTIAVDECWDELRLLRCFVDGCFRHQAPDLGATRQALMKLGQLLDRMKIARIAVAG